MAFIEPCFGIGHNLSLICQMTSEDIKHQLIIIIWVSTTFSTICWKFLVGQHKFCLPPQPSADRSPLLRVSTLRTNTRFLDGSDVFYRNRNRKWVTTICFEAIQVREVTPKPFSPKGKKHDYLRPNNVWNGKVSNTIMHNIGHEIPSPAWGKRVMSHDIIRALYHFW